MRTLLSILCIVFIASLSSCGSLKSHNIEANKVAGYTLKSKKEQLQQKVLQNKSKTIVSQP